MEMDAIHKNQQLVIELEQQRERAMTFFAFSPTACLVCDPRGIIKEANAAFYALFGSERPARSLPLTPSSSIQDLVNGSDREQLIALYHDAVQKNVQGNCTVRLRLEGDQYRWVRISLRSFNDRVDGQQVFAALSDLHQEQERIEQSETLLRELNHRIKNSLGLLVSILQLEASRGSKKVDISAILERVMALSKVYDQLYQKGFEETLDAGFYLRELCTSLVAGYAGTGNLLSVNLVFDELILETKRCFSLGLLATELVSNALRYSFPPDFKGTLTVAGVNNHDQTYSLTVTSGGTSGLPDDFNLETMGGTGLQLVQHLSAQLRGTLQIETGIPTSFTLRFPSRDR